MSPCLLNPSRWDCFLSFFSVFQLAWLKQNTHCQYYNLCLPPAQWLENLTLILWGPFLSPHFSTWQMQSTSSPLLGGLNYALSSGGIWHWKSSWLGLGIPLRGMTKPTDRLESISCILVPWDLGLMSIILTEIIKNWYPLHICQWIRMWSVALSQFYNEVGNKKTVECFLVESQGKHCLLPYKEWALNIKCSWWGMAHSLEGYQCLLISSFGELSILG